MSVRQWGVSETYWSLQSEIKVELKWWSKSGEVIKAGLSKVDMSAELFYAAALEGFGENPLLCLSR